MAGRCKDAVRCWRPRSAVLPDSHAGSTGSAPPIRRHIRRSTPACSRFPRRTPRRPVALPAWARSPACVTAACEVPTATRRGARPISPGPGERWGAWGAWRREDAGHAPSMRSGAGTHYPPDVPARPRQTSRRPWGFTPSAGAPARPPGETAEPAAFGSGGGWAGAARRRMLGRAPSHDGADGTRRRRRKGGTACAYSTGWRRCSSAWRGCGRGRCPGRRRCCCGAGGRRLAGPPREG